MPFNLQPNPAIITGVILLGIVPLVLWNIGLQRENRRLKTLTLMDSLTSLPNRRGFELLIQKAIREARRSNQPLSMLLLNLDSFSNVNQDYGFDIGDALLERIAHQLREAQPHANIPCRWSGDEFIILLKDVGHVAAQWSAEKMRAQVERELFRIDDRSLHITVSLGTATLNETDDHTSVIQRAHLSLLNAKQSGGNICCSIQE
ncbi:MAG: GGDEF domain-containing protein [Reinekea sp.]